MIESRSTDIPNVGLPPYDAVLVVSFGGPEGRQDVMPFLENALRGRNVPRQRMLEVAHHYDLLDGVSPINAQNRALIDALQLELRAHGIDLPIYLGNRNWRPFLPDVLRQMRDDGVRHALAFLPSPYSSYSGCRQYRQNISQAQQAVGRGAPRVSVLRKFHNHPGFIEPNVENLGNALQQIPDERRAEAHVAFTAHSIPVAMAETSMYERQLAETCRRVASGAGVSNWSLVYQSRSGSPGDPWLEPDISDYLRVLADRGVRDVVVLPVGFISDHMEVIYDIDHEALQEARRLGLNMIRAATVGTHRRFVAMIRELIVEQMTSSAHLSAIGNCVPVHEACFVSCCQPASIGEASYPGNPVGQHASRAIIAASAAAPPAGVPSMI